MEQTKVDRLIEQLGKPAEGAVLFLDAMKELQAEDAIGRSAHRALGERIDAVVNQLNLHAGDSWDIIGTVQRRIDSLEKRLEQLERRL